MSNKLSKQDDLTAIISNLEKKVHDLNHREKILRRHSSFFHPISSVDYSKLNDKNEETNSMKAELENVRLKLRNIEASCAEKNNQIKKKNDEIQALKRQSQKMVDCFKKEIDQKNAYIRFLNDKIVDLKGQIRVAIRVRDTKNECFTIISQSEIRFQQNDQSNVFHFEHIFPPTATQKDVFDEIEELILSALHGKNVCLIAYGPTGTGKTFTMRGGADNKTEGIIPRTINFLLEQSTREKTEIGWSFAFYASFIEVYNEEVFDLLHERKKLDVKIAGKSTTVIGLRKFKVNDLTDVIQLLEKVDLLRSTSFTACNRLSSRSHVIFTLYIEGSNETGETVQCCLNLVDLAGSERAKEAQVEGKHFKELTNINQSLSTLKNCIRAQMRNMAHVPFRDSKLTSLLREYLAPGSSKTMFIAHVNPTDSAETKRTLEFTSDLRSTCLGKSIVQTGQGQKQ